MTEAVYSSKIKPEHLARKAIVYLRQSSEKQVRQNKESQFLQYAVAERVRALGWKQVEIINSDLGSSAGIASAQREGFERVLSLVALGEVGIVGSREVSRLSRTDKDWCRLLEVCQIFGTLIADEQQVYDLSYLDDQLVLGIKGTLSVIELKVIRQRLLAGQEFESPPRRTVQKASDWVCPRRCSQGCVSPRSTGLRSDPTRVHQVSRTVERASDLPMVP